MAVQRPSAQSKGRASRAEGQPAATGADLHHLSNGSPEREFDCLFRRFLWQGPGAGPALRRALTRVAELLVDVPGPHHRRGIGAFLLRREPPEIELTLELDAELASLCPADDASD